MVHRSRKWHTLHAHNEEHLSHRNNQLLEENWICSFVQFLSLTLFTCAHLLLPLILGSFFCLLQQSSFPPLRSMSFSGAFLLFEVSHFAVSLDSIVAGRRLLNIATSATRRGSARQQEEERKKMDEERSIFSFAWCIVHASPVSSIFFSTWPFLLLRNRCRVKMVKRKFLNLSFVI